MNAFIVYASKDKKNLLRVKKILLDLEVNPIVLDEIPPHGTIFDKLISASSDVQKAIVIYSGFDYGCRIVKKLDKAKLVKRAKENVVFELGFFIALLKIQNVLVLLNKNIDRSNLPSDLSGLETVRLCTKDETLKKNIAKFLIGKWGLKRYV